jgi:hypothetical protein
MGVDKLSIESHVGKRGGERTKCRYGRRLSPARVPVLCGSHPRGHLLPVVRPPNPLAVGMQRGHRKRGQVATSPQPGTTITVTGEAIGKGASAGQEGRATTVSEGHEGWVAATAMGDTDAGGRASCGHRRGGRRSGHDCRLGTRRADHDRHRRARRSSHVCRRGARRADRDCRRKARRPSAGVSKVNTGSEVATTAGRAGGGTSGCRAYLRHWW